jgi:hypothetical protein
MGNPFAAIESAINCATLGVLNNATARIGGVSINGIFDDNYVDRLGMASSGPAFTCLTELPAMHQTTVMADNRRRDRERGTQSVPVDTTYGTAVSITYKGRTSAYTVAELQHDGAGMTVILLK